MARTVEKFTVVSPLYPAITSYPVRRSGAMYGLGFYSTTQQPVDMALKAGIGAGLGWLASSLFGLPHGALLGAAAGLGSAVYSNWKLQQQAPTNGVSGCGC